MDGRHFQNCKVAIASLFGVVGVVSAVLRQKFKGEETAKYRWLVDAMNSLKIGKTEVETLTSTFDQSHAGLTFGISLKLHVILPQRLKGKTIDLKPILVKPRGSYNPGQNVLRHLEHEARKHTLLIKSVFNLL